MHATVIHVVLCVAQLYVYTKEIAGLPNVQIVEGRSTKTAMVRKMRTGCEVSLGNVGGGGRWWR